jgi:hypothetical protein
VKHIWTVLALCTLGLAALALGTSSDADVVRPVVVWTARLTLVLFVAAFVSLGQAGLAGARRIVCRSAAFGMALHLLAIVRLAQLTGKPPLAFGGVAEAITSLGGAAAAALVVLGWPFWDRRWYRWAVYWPWVVFLFTYVVLVQQGDENARVFAAPLFFVPVVVVLLVALVWRARLDFKAIRF